MSIYDQTYSQIADELNVPDKRLPIISAFLHALLFPLQWAHDRIFTTYAGGSSDAAYSSSTAYTLGQRVIYTDHAVYECILNASAGINPTNSVYWYQISPNFIGVNERILYNGQKIVFEWALNKWFGTTFRQPPGTSDIYLTINPKTPPVFIIGENESSSSDIFSQISIYDNYIINGDSFSNYYSFTINIPLAVFNALDSNASNREPIVRKFADKYNNAGFTYSVVTY